MELLFRERTAEFPGRSSKSTERNVYIVTTGLQSA